MIVIHTKTVESEHTGEREERRVRIPMPWKSNYYSINWDEMRRGRKVLFIAWYSKFGCFFLRAGWTYEFDPGWVRCDTHQDGGYWI